jgi:hypothetical protein
MWLIILRFFSCDWGGKYRGKQGQPLVSPPLNQCLTQILMSRRLPLVEDLSQLAFQTHYPHTP